MKYISIILLSVLLVVSGCSLGKTEKDIYPFYKDELCGYIDYSGRIVVPPVYRSCTRFSENLASVTDTDGIGYIYTRKGQQIEIGKNAYVDDFHDGLAKILTDKKKGFIDTTGKYVIDKPNSDLSDFSEGYAVVGESYYDDNIKGYQKRFCYIDRLGKDAFNRFFSYACSFSEGFAVTKQNNRFVIINTQGKECLSLDYDYIGPFRQGLAVVGKGAPETRLYGFINKKGDLVIPIIYSYCDDFCNGYAAVQRDGKMGIINKKGKWIRSFPYDLVESPQELIITIKHNGKWGFVTLDGKVIHEPTFDDIDIYGFKNGMARVSYYVSRDGMNQLDSGYLRKDGRLIWDKDINNK